MILFTDVAVHEGQVSWDSPCCCFLSLSEEKTTWLSHVALTEAVNCNPGLVLGAVVFGVQTTFQPVCSGVEWAFPQLLGLAKGQEGGGKGFLPGLDSLKTGMVF